MQVDVHQAHLITLLGQRQRKVGGNAAFAHSAFSAHNQDLMLDLVQLAANHFFS